MKACIIVWFWMLMTSQPFKAYSFNTNLLYIDNCIAKLVKLNIIFKFVFTNSPLPFLFTPPAITGPTAPQLDFRLYIAVIFLQQDVAYKSISGIRIHFQFSSWNWVAPTPSRTRYSSIHCLASISFMDTSSWRMSSVMFIICQ